MTSIKAIAAAVQGLEAKLQGEIDQTGADLENMQSKLQALSELLAAQGADRKRLDAENLARMETLCQAQAAEMAGFIEGFAGYIKASLEGHAKTTHAAIAGGE